MYKERKKKRASLEKKKKKANMTKTGFEPKGISPGMPPTVKPALLPVCNSLLYTIKTLVLLPISAPPQC